MKKISSRIFSNLNNIFRKKRLAAKMLLVKEFPVRAGFWLIKPEFSRRVTIHKLPPPLDKAKQWGGWRNGRVLKVLMSVAEYLIFPWFVWVRGDKQGKFYADIVLINRLREPVGFDLNDKRVIRKLSNNEIDTLLINASKISDIYSLTEFEVDHESGYVIENMIAGTAFSYSSSINRLFSVNKFIEGLKMVESDILSDAVMMSWKDASYSLLPRLNMEEKAKVEVEKNIINICTSAKKSWVHGDLFGENIIINSTGRPIIIDIDKAGIAPTFTDIMTLFVFEARTLRFDLMDKFFRGDYDAELNKLGLPLETDKNNNVKLAVFITWLGWKMTTERFAEINLTRFFNVLTKYIDIKIKVEHI